jgi:hypothetical protein
VRSATSNPQRSLLRNRPHGYETAKRSTARHDRRRNRPAGTSPTTLRAAMALCPWRRDTSRSAFLSARPELHACTGKANDELDPACCTERDLLVRLGAVYSVNRLAVAAFPARAPRSHARHRDSRAVGRGLFVRPHCGHERGAVGAFIDADVSILVRGQAVGAPELRLGDDDLLGHRRAQSRRPLLSRVARSRAARVATRNRARRIADGSAAAPAAATFSVQHTSRGLDADAQGCARGGSHADAPQRSSPDDT